MGNKYSVTADPLRRRLWMPPLKAEPVPARRPLILPDDREGEDDRLSGPPNAYASTVHGQDVDEDPAAASKTIAAATTAFDEDNDDEGEDRSIISRSTFQAEAF